MDRALIEILLNSYNSVLNKMTGIEFDICACGACQNYSHFHTSLIKAGVCE